MDNGRSGSGSPLADPELVALLKDLKAGGWFCAHGLPKSEAFPLAETLVEGGRHLGLGNRLVVHVEQDDVYVSKDFRDLYLPGLAPPSKTLSVYAHCETECPLCDQPNPLMRMFGHLFA